MPGDFPTLNSALANFVAHFSDDRFQASSNQSFNGGRRAREEPARTKTLQGREVQPAAR